MTGPKVTAATKATGIRQDATFEILGVFLKATGLSKTVGFLETTVFRKATGLLKATVASGGAAVSKGSDFKTLLAAPGIFEF